MSKKDRISFSEFYIYEFFDMVREKTRGTYDHENFQVIDEMFSLLSEQKEITEGIGKLAQEQASGELSIFLFDIYDRAQDYPPTELVDALPEIADDFVSGLSIMLEEEGTLNAIKLVNNQLRGSTIQVEEEVPLDADRDLQPEEVTDTDAQSFTEFVEQRFISDLRASLLVQSSEEDTGLFIDFTQLLIENLNKPDIDEFPELIHNLMKELHQIYPWISGMPYSPTVLVSMLPDIIKIYTSQIRELDMDVVKNSLKEGKIVLPEKDKKEVKFEHEEVPEKPTTIDKLLSEYFQIEVDEYISNLQKVFNTLEISPNDTSQLNKLIEEFQSFKEISMIHGYVKLEDFCSDMLALLIESKKKNLSYNPQAKKLVESLFSVLKKTDKFKDAKVETPESAEINSLLNDLSTTLFIEPSVVESDIALKKESAAEESVAPEEKEINIEGRDKKSLIDIFESLLKDLEPVLKQELSEQASLPGHFEKLLSRLVQAARIIDQKDFRAFFKDYFECGSAIRTLDQDLYRSAANDFLDIYGAFLKQISEEFRYNDSQIGIAAFKDKYLLRIKNISFDETDDLLKVLMEIENQNATGFVQNLNAILTEHDPDIKLKQIKHFERLTKNIELLGATNLIEFPRFYLSLVQEPPDSLTKNNLVEQIGTAYRSMIKLVTDNGKDADIQSDIDKVNDLLNRETEVSDSVTKEDAQPESELIEEVEEEAESKEAEVSDVSEEEDLDEIFKQESENYMTTIDEAIDKLNINPDETANYEKIEKSLHSLKSSARLMGYNDVADVASPLEELFETLHETQQKLRDEDLKILNDVVSHLSAGIHGESVDSALLIEKLKSVEVTKPIDQPAGQKSGLREEQLFASSSDEDEDLLEIFKDESGEYITIVEKATESLSNNPQDKKALVDLEQAMHSLKTAAMMLGFSEIGQVADGVEKVAVETQKGEISNTTKMNNSISSAIELIKDLTAGHKKSNQDLAAIISNLDIDYLKKDEDEQTKEIKEVSEGKKSSKLDEQTDIFIKEGWELIERINRDLVNLEKDPKDQSVIDNLNRSIHTLKGSAQILNFQRIGKLAHKIEDLFAKSKESEEGLTENHMDLTFKAVDAIQDLLNSIKNGEEEHGAEADLIIEQIDEELAKTGSEALPEDGTYKTVVPQTTPKIIPVEKMQEAYKDSDQVIKITSETLDNLVNMAAELIINKTQLSSYVDKLRSIVETLDDDKKRLRKTNRTIASFLEKTVGDNAEPDVKKQIDKQILDDIVSVSDEFKDVMNTFDTVSGSFRTITQEFEENIGQISTLTKSLHDDILQVRMIPTEMLFNRFPRAVRDLAKKLKKKVNLVVEGEKTEMDRALIESLTDPVMHLVRNAVDHGIEIPPERKKIGKSEDGIILLKAKRSKNQILIEVQDDGAGIDPKVVKGVILKKKLVSEEELEAMSTTEIMDFVFHPGFSTRDEASDVSGRGVGLDVVADQLKKLKGDIRINSTPGKGTIFSIRVPLSLAIAQAMLVKVGPETLAVPITSVEETIQFKDPELVEQDEKAFITVRDKLIPVAYLSSLLNYRTGEKSAGLKSNTAIIVQEAGVRYALIVDDVLRREEIVIKSLGEHLAHVPYISGGTIYGDGSVGLILDIPSITQKIEADVYGQDKDFSDIERAREIVSSESGKKPTEEKVVDKEPKRKVVMSVKKRKIKGRPPKALIVDDSISVLKFVSSVLEKNKYATVLTEDGPEALEQLRKEKFDIIITDLEMPKMHGFDLIQEIRSYKKYQRIPIVILTGRAGKKHKDRSSELGANAYITKPFKENDLLKTLEDFIEIA